jgi:hypothetical protein
MYNDGVSQQACNHYSDVFAYKRVNTYWCSMWYRCDDLREEELKVSLVEAKIPFAFNISRRDFPSMYSTVTFMLLASLCVGCSFRWIFEILIRPLISIYHISSRILFSSSISQVASSIAFRDLNSWNIFQCSFVSWSRHESVFLFLFIVLCIMYYACLSWVFGIYDLKGIKGQYSFFLIFIGKRSTAWTISVWKYILFFLEIFLISFTCWLVPISLL